MVQADEHFCSAEELWKACASLPGQHVLEVTPDNVVNYNCGAFWLVQRDLEAVLPSAHARQALQLLRSAGVPEAFHVREELVNYKKVCLHVHQQGVLLERSLSQLATFFRTSEWSEELGCSVHTPERSMLSRARTQCKGRCEASYDARLIGKLLCGLPRHPDTARQASLAQLPRSLRCWHLGAAAGAVAMESSAAADTCEPEELSTDVRYYSLRVAAAAGSRAASEPRRRSYAPALTQADLETKAFAVDECATFETPGVVVGEQPASWHDGMLAKISALPWPAHGRQCLRKVAICRGADKALRIRDELWRVREALRRAVAQAQASLQQLDGQPMPEDVEAERLPGKDCMAMAVRRRRHWNLLTGCLPFLREALSWFDAIEQAATQQSRLFMAGDARGPGIAAPVLCVPAGFEGCRLLDETFRQLILSYKAQMMQSISANGWPEHVSSRRGAVTEEAGATGAPEKTCKVCARQFSTLWVHRGICCQCEELSRAEGRCPFGSRCEASSFCPHERRCFVCDAHSCQDCRLARGDGEFVLDLANRLRPARIAIDFDRTLATTRSGGLPIVGQHSADSDLMSLLWLHRAACMIVTRNSHTEAIRAFLSANGAPADVPVHSIRRPTSKAEVLVPSLGPEEQAILVDDSIAELTDPMVAGQERVHRVLFVRALL